MTVILSGFFAKSVAISVYHGFRQKSRRSRGIFNVHNWFFYDAKDESKNRLGNAKFVFDHPNFQRGSVDYLLLFHYSEKVKAKGIEVLFKNKDMYKNFNEQIANLKYKLTSSTIDNGSIIKVYKKGPQIIEVTIPPNFNEMNGYRYLFAKNSSYKKIRNK